MNCVSVCVCGGGLIFLISSVINGVCGDSWTVKWWRLRLLLPFDLLHLKAARRRLDSFLPVCHLSSHWPDKHTVALTFVCLPPCFGPPPVSVVTHLATWLMTGEK